MRGKELRVFRRELEQLSLTYSHAAQCDIEPLVRLVSRAALHPLIVVGSGGSLSVAYHVASLHQRLTGRVSKAVTPLELMLEFPSAENAAVCCITAGGNNPDIVSAFRVAAQHEPSLLFALCGREDSKIVRLSRKFPDADAFVATSPARDGFLATQSLLMFSVLVSRAYYLAAGQEADFPPTLAELLHQGITREEFESRLKESCRRLWTGNTLSVLFDPETRPAAVDLESKFIEAALGDVHIADFRNFAHGRHHWFAKRSQSTSLLALSGPQASSLAEQTLSLLPSDVPVVHIKFEGNSRDVQIRSLVTGMHIVAFAGEMQGIDPGRPGVPEFGRRIYHLKSAAFLRTEVREIRAQAIHRKMKVARGVLARPGAYSFWEYALDAYIGRLESAAYAGIVLDYDGTLCAPSGRYGGLDRRVAAELKRLLKGGMIVAVASGRGLSLRDVLREALAPSLWQRILIGFYNGAIVQNLDDEKAFPDKPVFRELTILADRLSESRTLSRLAKIKLRSHQISIVPQVADEVEGLWSIVERIVRTADLEGTSVVRTSHSIDVLAPGVSKLNLLERVKQHASGRPVLCVGDQGQWPGNDFLLLSQPFSLSVAEISADPDSCWNLAPPGYRHLEASLYYLRSFAIESSGSARFRPVLGEPHDLSNNHSGGALQISEHDRL